MLILKSRTRGFSLVEVLVALLVISIGLLGIAKMQALALSNTNGGRLRALAAIEAGSLAATMQAERNYWGNVATALTITAKGSGSSSVITSTDTTQAGTVTCGAASSTSIGLCTGTLACTSTASPCTAQNMAAYDLQQWAGRLQQVIPTNYVSISCTALTSTTPVTCQITINWAEETVNSTASEAGGTMATPSYTLLVNP